MVEEPGGRREMGRICIDRGAVRYKMGELEKAEEEIQKGLALLEGTEALGHQAAGYHYLGVVSRSRGDYQQAVQMHRRSLELREKTGDRWGIALSYNNLGIALIRKEKLEEAIAHFRKALRIKPDYANAHENLERALELPKK